MAFYMYKVYLLKSLKDNKYYIGQTDNLERRFGEHNSGKSKSTKNRRPFILIGYENYSTRNEARYREYRIKNSIEKQEFIKEMLKQYAKETAKKNNT